MWKKYVKSRKRYERSKEAFTRRYSRRLKMIALKMKGYSDKEIAYELNCSLDDITHSRELFPLFLGLVKRKPRK